MADVKITKRKVTDYIPDPRNANTGTERGQYMIDHSVTEVGMARSIVAAADGTIPAGNKTLQAAVDAGIEDVIEVETDGHALVVVKRKDWPTVDDPRARKYAYLDNRASEVGLAWDAAQVLADLEVGVDLSDMWHEDEIDALLRSLHPSGWNPTKDTTEGNGDGIDGQTGYGLSSFWKDISRHTVFSKYFLGLPAPPTRKSGSATVKNNYSRTNAEETERIVKTYMRPGDYFFEMCCGWMTFSSTAKFFGFSGKGGDIWDVSLEFCQRQIKAMPGDGNVEVIYADCLNTGEPSEVYDFVHSNPPFFSLEPYGGDDNDLANVGSYERWLDAIAGMGKEAARILKPGGLANFVINDFRRDGILIPMHADFMQAIMRSSGLLLHDFVVAEVMSQALRFRKHDYERRRTVKCHEYVITFRKPV